MKLIIIFLSFPLLLGSAAFGISLENVVENFESGTVILKSYDGQDHDPDSWQLTQNNAYSGTSLRLTGNTWKTESISSEALSDSTIWQVAVYGQGYSEMQAFGISDGQNELFYTLFGSELPAEDNWYTVYQGAFSFNRWELYQLPIGRDWMTRFGYLPTINQLIFVNDDDSGSPGTVLFDEIADITQDLPHPPQVSILYTVEGQQKISAKLHQLSIQFQGEVFDPDSQEHTWNWDFGDSTVSTQPNPSHTFLVHADYPYTVGLNVTDTDGLAAGDTCQIAVSAGSGEGPLTVNFVGDVFTGRGFENNGGIIDTHGIESLFTPTLEIFGQAADVNVANLEVPYTNRGTPHPTKSVVFRSRPENISGIQYAGVDLVTLGNNHIIDYGEIGMLDTMAGLDDLNIRYSGAGSSEYMALLPTFWTEKGVRLGFLGLCNRTGRQWNYQPFLDAGYNKPGFAYLLPQNLATSIDYTQPLADIVIVQTHSGDEYLPSPGSGAASFALPPRIEATTIGPDDIDFKFRNEPTPGEVGLRRAAIELGADILINHHPHVLQGFESYQDKLIAHSLGNFIFDLYYTETMPTLVLTLEMEKTGLTGYRFTPAWINHWIPEPATGNLGREIVSRLADYSRPMNALVVPINNSNEARIHLSRAGIDSTLQTITTNLALVSEDGYAYSPPYKFSDDTNLGVENLSSLSAISANGTWQIRYGREILWHGGFEDEGADLWDVNTDDEYLTSDEFHNGQRSLRLRRFSEATVQTGTDLQKHLPCDPTKEHSAAAWFKADNAFQARTMVRFYNNRYSNTPLTDTDLDPRFDGSCDWTYQWHNLTTPADAVYFDMRCGHEPPASDTAYSWYDDLAMIEWEPWHDAGSNHAVPSPNNFRYLQVRGPENQIEEIDLTFTKTAYGPLQSSHVIDNTPQISNPTLRCFPNPFNPRITIEVDLTKSSTVSTETIIEIFDLRGRKIRQLFQGNLTAGKRHGLTWNGQDDDGRSLSSGVYLVKVQRGELGAVQKVSLVR